MRAEAMERGNRRKGAVRMMIMMMLCKKVSEELPECSTKGSNVGSPAQLYGCCVHEAICRVCSARTRFIHQSRACIGLVRWSQRV